MKITFLGAAGTVTGSSYVLTSGSGQSILIDLGMFQGTPEVEALNYEPYEYDCSQLFAAILTHAHLDHCGRLPILLSHGFTGKIWMTPPTRELTELSLLDAAKIAKKDHKTVLFDEELAMQTFERFVEIEYRETVKIGDFEVTFYDAGHILGSASIEITDTKPDSEYKTIVFSGDLGNTPSDLVEETELLEHADVVVMESTYGDSLHPNLKAMDMIQAEINAVESSGGALLIPAFALERTQELLHIIMHLKKTGKVKAQTPVFMDSPMALHATEIYLGYVDMLNEHIQNDERTSGAFEFPGLRVTRKREDSEGIWDTPGAKVIIAGGGMMTGGRIVSHAAHYLAHPQNRLLIVGYQGEETLGRELLEGETKVVINEVTIPVKAGVSSTRAMSSHADQRQLIEWLGAIKGVKKVILTHGEDGPRAGLAEKITQELQISDVAMPHLHDEIQL
jgi:metallo-beta-lactamase family protein